MNRVMQLTCCYLLLATLVFTFDGCTDKCQVKNHYYYYEPVYQTTAEIKAATGMQAARQVKSPGKIYIKGIYLFVNELGQGIHIFDNHNPSAPVGIGFLNIPGNVDMAIRDNVLLADSYVDLVSFDITHIDQITEIARLGGLFQSTTSYGFGADAVKGVVTSWKLKESVTVMTSECEAQIQPWGGLLYADGIGLNNFSAAAPTTMAAIPSGSNTGLGGSTARFTIMGNYLYGLDGTNLEIVDLSNPKLPVSKNSITVAWDAETLFPAGKTLFLGARAGMYMFDMTYPELPTLVGQYDHIQSCDPVVVEGDYAYVTLYSGGLCHVPTNQLEVVNIHDIKSPQLASVYEMTNPRGVGIDDGVLFICDGPSGLKIYDASDPMTISQHMLAQYSTINAADVIPYNGIAIITGSDGIYQYDYSNISAIKLLSSIPIAKQ